MRHVAFLVLVAIAVLVGCEDSEPPPLQVTETSQPDGPSSSCDRTDRDKCTHSHQHSNS